MIKGYTINTNNIYVIGVDDRNDLNESILKEMKDIFKLNNVALFLIGGGGIVMTETREIELKVDPSNHNGYIGTKWHPIPEKD